MARNYAGILGLLAMLVVSFRSLIHGSSGEQALFSATIALVLFTIAGLVIGSLAEGIVLDSVWTKVRAELGALDKDSPDAQKQ